MSKWHVGQCSPETPLCGLFSQNEGPDENLQGRAKNKRPADFWYRSKFQKRMSLIHSDYGLVHNGWVSSIQIPSCLFFVFVHQRTAARSFSLFLLSLLSVGLCPSRCNFGFSLVFVAAVNGRARRHAYRMLFGLELSRSGIGRRGEEPCVFLRIWIIYTTAHEVVDNRTQWGETRVCLSVCLFVCCVAVRENESGGKEGRTASGAYFVYE
jgi:hypothetical protein